MIRFLHLTYFPFPNYPSRTNFSNFVLQDKGSLIKGLERDYFSARWHCTRQSFLNPCYEETRNNQEPINIVISRGSVCIQFIHSVCGLHLARPRHVFGMTERQCERLHWDPPPYACQANRVVWCLILQLQILYLASDLLQILGLLLLLNLKVSI